MCCTNLASHPQAVSPRTNEDNVHNPKRLILVCFPSVFEAGLSFHGIADASEVQSCRFGCSTCNDGDDEFVKFVHGSTLADLCERTRRKNGIPAAHACYRGPWHPPWPLFRVFLLHVQVRPPWPHVGWGSLWAPAHPSERRNSPCRGLWSAISGFDRKPRGRVAPRRRELRSTNASTRDGHALEASRGEPGAWWGIAWTEEEGDETCTGVDEADDGERGRHTHLQDVLTSFAASIGANGGDVNFQDVYGLDEELLAMVPTPVLAVVVLYPLTEATEAIQPNPTGQKPTDLFYMKQTIGNACGTIAVMHCLTNNTERIRLEEGSFLDRFIKDTVNMTPEARGKFLEEQSDLESAHAGAASEGDTVAPGVDDEINLHFVALVNKGGRLLELDGRKAGPIDHGPTSEETLLQDSAKIVKNLVQITNSYNFSILALCKA